MDNLKKKILYRSEHRGTKEMDLLLSNFVKKYINSLNESELCELELLLNIDDEVLYKWYLNNERTTLIPENSITKKLKEFKLQDYGGEGGI
ncbi:MAG: succinate dehydrogenase assembly factor 2 [Alphaproteobacteria bacterium]|nr:MAG: succinate dehydrogenase assembly factor 2 [Alphaproteobacteria bacterium]